MVARCAPKQQGTPVHAAASSVACCTLSGTSCVFQSRMVVPEYVECQALSQIMFPDLLLSEKSSALVVA